jgi:hypothetical protein
VPFGARGPLVVNNTLAANQANTGMAVFASGFYTQAAFVNNILVGDGPASVIECDGSFDPGTPTLRFNDVSTPVRALGTEESAPTRRA